MNRTVPGQLVACARAAAAPRRRASRCARRARTRACSRRSCSRSRGRCPRASAARPCRRGAARSARRRRRQVGDHRRHRVAGAHVEAEAVERVEHEFLRARQLEPELGRAVDAPPQLDDGRAATRSASARSSVGDDGGHEARLAGRGTTLAARRRTPPRTRAYAARSASPALASATSSAGSSGSARTCASAAAPATNALGERRASLAASESRVRVLSCVGERVARASPRPRTANSVDRERAGSSSGRARPPRALRRRRPPTPPRRRRARQVVGPGPHALAQLRRSAAGASRRAARARSPARRARRAPTTAMRHAPFHAVAVSGRGSSPARPAAADPARELVRPVRRRSSPRSTIRLSATRAVPSATPNSPHHCTSRAPRIRGGCDPQQEAGDQRPGASAAARALAYYVLATSVARV